ncbi:MAG: hypothetical protein EA369_04245 [Bradymonadales bacterium]|nr:MAG: hypothetical protein EA369_04245 [Bradymonadales bacterium]
MPLKLPKELSSSEDDFILLYRTKSGDSLDGILRSFHALAHERKKRSQALAWVKKLNPHIRDGDLIFPDQALLLPNFSQWNLNDPQYRQDLELQAPKIHEIWRSADPEVQEIVFNEADNLSTLSQIAEHSPAHYVTGLGPLMDFSDAIAPHLHSHSLGLSLNVQRSLQIEIRQLELFFLQRQQQRLRIERWLLTQVTLRGFIVITSEPTRYRSFAASFGKVVGFAKRYRFQRVLFGLSLFDIGIQSWNYLDRGVHPVRVGGYAATRGTGLAVGAFAKGYTVKACLAIPAATSAGGPLGFVPTVLCVAGGIGLLVLVGLGFDYTANAFIPNEETRP